MRPSSLSNAIMVALSSGFARSSSLDYILDYNNLFKTSWRNLEQRSSKRENYCVSNYNSNFNHKNNFRTQVYNNSKLSKIKKYSRKHN